MPSEGRKIVLNKIITDCKTAFPNLQRFSDLKQLKICKHESESQSQTTKFI